MVNNYTDAVKYGVNPDEQPSPLGNGAWKPSGFVQMGNQWVTPNATPNQSALTTAMAPPSPSNSRWNPEAKAQMDKVGQTNNYQWSDAEYDQWLGPSGYISKDDVDGTGRKMGAYAGGDVDPYWLMRMGLHARNEDDGSGLAQMKAQGQNVNQSAAANIQSSGMNSALSGDPMAKIQEAIEKINGKGQVNFNALMDQLVGV